MTDSISDIKNEEIQKHLASINKMIKEINRAIVGQKNMIQKILIGVLTEGHILVEGVPGLAKTTVIKSISETIGGDFKRIQFTPDLLPSDIIGTEIYSYKEDSFRIKTGPVVTNFLLADEINRAPAKVQSALLESMQEKQVTIGEKTILLPNPFLVMATQNPVEQEGTYPLPEAQVDRFMLKINVDYPTKEEEVAIMKTFTSQNKGSEIKQVLDLNELVTIKKLIENIYVDDKVYEYIGNIVNSTRFPEKYRLMRIKPYIQFGASPRASLFFVIASRALAFLQGRTYVMPQDIKDLSHEILRHRILLNYEAEAENISQDSLISEILENIPVP